MPIILDGTNGISQTTGVVTAPGGSASAPSITRDGDTNTGIYFPAADTIGFTEGGTEVGRFDSSGNLQFNSGYGSVATAYGCRAWVNFNGTGTVAIRASGNVSSITDNNVGNYTVNFTNALPDANYSAVGCAEANSPTGNWPFVFGTNGAQSSTTSVGIQTRNDAGNAVDCPTVSLHVFR